MQHSQITVCIGQIGWSFCFNNTTPSDIGCSFIVDIIFIINLQQQQLQLWQRMTRHSDTAQWTKATSVDCNVPSVDYSQLILNLIVTTQTHINFELNQTHNSYSLSWVNSNSLITARELIHELQHWLSSLSHATVTMMLFTCNFIICGTAAGTDHVILMQSTISQ